MSVAYRLLICAAFAIVGALLAGIWARHDLPPLVAALLAGGLAGRFVLPLADGRRFLRATALLTLALTGLVSQNLTIPLLAPQTDLRLEALAETGDHGQGGREIWLTGARDADGAAIDLDGFVSDGGWERRSDLWVFHGDHPAVLSWRGRTPAVTLHFIKHPWSGKVRIVSAALPQPLILDLSAAQGADQALEIGGKSPWTLLQAPLAAAAIAIVLLVLVAGGRRRWPSLALSPRVISGLSALLPVAAWLFANALLPVPGMSPDSMGHYLQAVLPGATIPSPIDPPYKPPFMTIAMAPLVQAWGAKGYILVQSAFFYLATGVFLCRLLPPGVWRPLALAAVCFHPAVIALAMTMWVDTLMTAFLLLAIGEAVAFARQRRGRSLAAALLLLFLGLSARFNVAIILPGVVLADLALIGADWVRHRPFDRRQILVVAALLAMAPATGLWNHHPKVIGDTVSTAPVFFLNQYVGTLRQAALNGKAEQPVFQEQRALVTAAFGEGSLDKLFATFTPIMNFKAWFYDEDFLGMRKAVLSGGFVLRQLPRVILAYPREFLDVKRQYLSEMLFAEKPFFCLGLCYPFHLSAEQEASLRLPEDRTPPHWLAGLASRLPDLLREDLAAYKHMKIWNMLLWCGLFLLCGLGLGDATSAFVGGLGLLYAIGFLLVDVAPEWRYFLFPFLCFAGGTARFFALGFTGADELFVGSAHTRQEPGAPGPP